MKAETRPKLFCAYARKDLDLVQELNAHLSPMKRMGLIDLWHDQDISPGNDWNDEIAQQLRMADVVILVVSPYFLGSNYCYEIEMTRAMERQERGESLVIPILLRPCDWSITPVARLQVLPQNALPVTKWPDIHSALEDVARGLRKCIEVFTQGSREDEALLQSRSMSVVENGVIHDTEYQQKQMPAREYMSVQSRVSEALASLPASMTLREFVDKEKERIERHMIEQALIANFWNVTHTCARLGLSRKGLQLKMRELGIQRRPTS